MGRWWGRRRDERELEARKPNDSGVAERVASVLALLPPDGHLRRTAVGTVECYECWIHSRSGCPRPSHTTKDLQLAVEVRRELSRLARAVAAFPEELGHETLEVPEAARLWWALERESAEAHREVVHALALAVTQRGLMNAHRCEDAAQCSTIESPLGNGSMCGSAWRSCDDDELVRLERQRLATLRARQAAAKTAVIDAVGAAEVVAAELERARRVGVRHLEKNLMIASDPSVLAISELGTSLLDRAASIKADTDAVERRALGGLGRLPHA